MHLLHSIWVETALEVLGEYLYWRRGYRAYALWTVLGLLILVICMVMVYRESQHGKTNPEKELLTAWHALELGMPVQDVDESLRHVLEETPTLTLQKGTYWTLSHADTSLPYNMHLQFWDARLAGAYLRMRDTPSAWPARAPRDRYVKGLEVPDALQRLYVK